MMDFISIKIVRVVVVAVVAAMASCSWAEAQDASKQIAREGCSDECGGVKIPFPFGIGWGCYLIDDLLGSSTDTYKIMCDNTSSTKPRPLIPILGNKEVLHISLQNQTIRVSSEAAYDCVNIDGQVPRSAPKISYAAGDGQWIPIIVSTTRNKFVTTGCDANAILQDTGQTPNYSGENIASCFTACYGVAQGPRDIDWASCETPILHNMTQPIINVYIRSSSRLYGNNCVYAFIGEVGSYDLSWTNTSVMGSWQNFESLWFTTGSCIPTSTRIALLPRKTDITR